MTGVEWKPGKRAPTNDPRHKSTMPPILVDERR